MAVVQWPDEIDEPLAGDLTAALAYNTPAGGTVVTAVAPIGLRDRERGSVSFTTSLGFGRKLERIRRDPRIALAYHAREHGPAGANGRYVLVQGSATVDAEPDRDYLEWIGRQAEPFMGRAARGPFWDRWLSAYYADRVPVHVSVERIVSWPDLGCEGEPVVLGEPWPAAPPEQAEPANGTGPRLDSERAGGALAKLAHQLVGYQGGDGRPVVVPVRVTGADRGAIRLAAADGLLPPGGRRAGVLAHEYRAKLIGLAARQHTGWLQVRDGEALYAPHTATGFRAPPNKTLLLLGTGYLARRGLRRARKGG
jgi:hypothetical protein